MMTCSNLSICVGPSLLWSSDPAYMMEQSYTKEVSATIQILIEDYERLFSREVPPLFLQEGTLQQNKEVNTKRGMLIFFKRFRDDLFRYLLKTLCTL
jgi:hypothetical protein